jgi:hypothetical protein
MDNKKQHRVASRIHAQRRAVDRYGVCLSVDDYEALCASVRNQKGQFIWRQSNTLTWWLVTHREVELLAVYRRSQKAIVTFLPMQAIDLLIDQELIEVFEEPLQHADLC